MHIRKVVGIAFVAMVLASNGCSAGIFSSKSEEEREAEKRNQDELKKLYAKLADLSKNARDAELFFKGSGYPSEQKNISISNLREVVMNIMKRMPKKITGYNPKDLNNPVKNTNAEKIKNALDFLDKCEILFSDPRSGEVWYAVPAAYNKSPIKIGTHISNMSIKTSDYKGTRKIKNAIKSFLTVVEKVYKAMPKA